MVSSLKDVTPALLTTLLTQAEVLRKGHVAEVKVQKSDAFNSVVAHLELAYSSDAPLDAPKNLVLKLNVEGHGKEEAGFYRLARDANVNTSMLVPCFSAAYEPETGTSHLLLLDVSATHTAPVTRGALLALDGVPSRGQLEAVVIALAKFHAAWWESPLLGQPGPTAVASSYNDEAAFHKRWERHRTEFAEFINQTEGYLSTDTRFIYENVLDNYPKLWTHIQPRVSRLSNLTLTHNDCYLTQFLCPRDEGLPTYLVDFQNVCTDFAARDLVYLFATFWTSGQRHPLERELLQLYHRTLVQNGVTGFSFDALLQDYRLTLTYMIFQPVWDFSYGADTAYWKPKMKCLTDAYVDLRCADLLGA